MAFVCPQCGRTSHHPMDERYGYCGACHQFTGDGEYDLETVLRLALGEEQFGRLVDLVRERAKKVDLSTYDAKLLVLECLYQLRWEIEHRN